MNKELAAAVERLKLWETHSALLDKEIRLILAELERRGRVEQRLRTALAKAIGEMEILKQAGFGIGAPDSWHDALAYDGTETEEK